MEKSRPLVVAKSKRDTERRSRAVAYLAQQATEVLEPELDDSDSEEEEVPPKVR